MDRRGSRLLHTGPAHVSVCARTRQQACLSTALGLAGRVRSRYIQFGSDLRKLLYQRTQVSAAQLSRGNDAAVVCSSRTGRGSAGSAAVGWLRQVPSIVETLAIKHGGKSRKEKRHRHGEGEGRARPYPATAESVPAESWSSSRRRVWAPPWRSVGLRRCANQHNLTVRWESLA